MTDPVEKKPPSTRQAVDAMKKLAKLFEPMAIVGAHLDSIASLEQAESEARQRQQKAYEEDAALQSQLEVQKKQVVENAKQADETLARAKTEAARLVADAQAQAQSYLVQGRKALSDEQAKARAETEALVSSANETALVQATRVRALKEEAVDLERQITAKEAEIKDAQARYDAIRSKIKEMAG